MPSIPMECRAESQDPWKYVDNSALLNLPCGEGSSAEALWANIEQISSISNIYFHNDQLCEAPNSPNFPASGTSVSSDNWAISSLELEDLQNHAEQRKLDRESLDAEENSYSLINAFSFSHAYNLQTEARLRLCFAGQNSYQAPRLYIQIPQDARVCILLDSRNLGPEVYWNPYFFFEIGPNAAPDTARPGAKPSHRRRTHPHDQPARKPWHRCESQCGPVLLGQSARCPRCTL